MDARVGDSRDETTWKDSTMRRRDVSNRDVASKSAAKGRVLCQLEEDIDADRRGTGGGSKAMEASPITVYETAYVEAQLRMIAVNDNFICYGIRNGLIHACFRENPVTCMIAYFASPGFHLYFKVSLKHGCVAFGGRAGSSHRAKIDVTGGRFRRRTRVFRRRYRYGRSNLKTWLISISMNTPDGHLSPRRLLRFTLADRARASSRSARRHAWCAVNAL